MGNYSETSAAEKYRLTQAEQMIRDNAEAMGLIEVEPGVWKRAAADAPASEADDA